MNQLEREAEYFKKRITDTWEKLGFFHDEYLLLSTIKWRRRVRFDQCLTSPTDIKLRIKTHVRIGDSIFHKIPPFVRVDDLVSEATLSELMMACERSITAEIRCDGVWLTIKRLKEQFR